MPEIDLHQRMMDHLIVREVAPASEAPPQTLASPEALAELERRLAALEAAHESRLAKNDLLEADLKRQVEATMDVRHELDLMCSLIRQVVADYDAADLEGWRGDRWTAFSRSDALGKMREVK